MRTMDHGETVHFDGLVVPLRERSVAGVRLYRDTLTVTVTLTVTLTLTGSRETL